MSGGTIRDNIATGYGGGVFLASNNNIRGFTMEGGEIRGNSAVEGGGVYITISAQNSNAFGKTGGAIQGGSGTTHTPGSINNTASSELGHAVRLIFTGAPRQRNSTAGVGQTMNSNQLGAAGGWE